MIYCCIEKLLEQYEFEHNVPALEIASALAKLYRGDKDLLLKKETPVKREAEQTVDRQSRKKSRSSNERFLKELEEGMQRYRLEVGHQHKVRPGNIVGAISNEAGIESKYIGRITIFEEYSLVDLPEGMPKEIFEHLKNTYVVGRKLQLSRYKPEVMEASSPEKAQRKKTKSKARRLKNKAGATRNKQKL